MDGSPKWPPRLAVKPFGLSERLCGSRKMAPQRDQNLISRTPKYLPLRGRRDGAGMTKGTALRWGRAAWTIQNRGAPSNRQPAQAEDLRAPGQQEGRELTRDGDSIHPEGSEDGRGVTTQGSGWFPEARNGQRLTVPEERGSTDHPWWPDGWDSAPSLLRFGPWSGS